MMKRIRWSIFKFARPVLYVRPSSFFLRLASSDRPKFLVFSKKKAVKPFFTWNNYFNLKNEHSNSIEKNRNKNSNIFSSILCILLIQLMWMLTFNGRVSSMMIILYCFGSPALKIVNLWGSTSGRKSIGNIWQNLVGILKTRSALVITVICGYKICKVHTVELGCGPKGVEGP